MDDIKNRTDEGGKFSLVTNNSDSRDDDEYDEVGIEVKTPLFLQMEMQVWASLPNPSDIVNGHQIPLRRVFILGFLPQVQTGRSSSTLESIMSIFSDFSFEVGRTVHFQPTRFQKPIDRNNFFTSIENLMHEINSKRSADSENPKIEKILLDKNFKVQLNFYMWMVNDDKAGFQIMSSDWLIL